MFSVEHVFSVEAMVRGYHSTRRLGIHLLVVKERWPGNIHSTFAVVITKDGEGSPASLRVVAISAVFFQTSELVINLRMDP